jgi:hypothetical protein
MYSNLEYPSQLFHFLCFVVTISMGIGVAILAGILHNMCWNSKLSAFWQIYITLVTIVIVIEICFRLGGDTKLNIWMDRIQRKYYLELFYVSCTSVWILIFGASQTAHSTTRILASAPHELSSRQVSKRYV